MKKFTKKERSEIKAQHSKMTKDQILDEMIDNMQNTNHSIETLEKSIATKDVSLGIFERGRDYFYNKCIKLSDENEVLRMKCERFKQEWMNAADHIFQIESERDFHNYAPIEDSTDGVSDENKAD